MFGVALRVVAGVVTERQGHLARSEMASMAEGGCGLGTLVGRGRSRGTLH